MAALEFVGQSLMVDAQQVQHCCVQIVHMDRVLSNIVSKIISFTVSDAWLHSSSGTMKIVKQRGW